jgi:Lrp/AsnC family transcriptional regulator for asnA, asnC and gidA
VRQRVQKLVDSGVMQVVAVTDPMQIGFARQAMVALSVSGDVEAIANDLAKIDEVVYIVVTAGSIDLLVEVVVEDDDHLLRLVNGRIRAIDGVERTETFLYLKLVKQTYNWGAK